MKKLLTALSVGLGLTVMFLWGLAAGPTLVAQARGNLPQARIGPVYQLPSLQAGTGLIRVAIGGVDVAGCGSAVAPCASVQFAVNEAIPGDTVILSAGTWNESVTLSTPISLTGVSSATAIIQALPGQRVLTVTGAAIDNSVVISGLTFSGGDVSGGNICFSGNTANCGGGILLTNNARPAIQNVIIENNNALRGGGLYANETGGLRLDAVIFRTNSAILTGGGLNARNMPVTVTNSLFQQNTTTNNVGGAMVTGADFGIAAPVLISNTTFLSNTAQCLGGPFSICEAPALYLFDQDTQIINSHFEGNSCTASNCDGGGVYLTASFNNPSLSLLNTDFISNTAGAQGGGVYATRPVQVTGGRFERNAAGGRQTAFSDGGGGMRVESLILTGTEFISNTSGEDGGAIHVRGDAVIRDARLTANQAFTNGAGIYVFLNLVMTNTEFISNTAGMNGGGAYVFIGDAQVTGGRFAGNRANGPENDGGFLTTQNGGGGLWAGRNLTSNGTEFRGNVAETNGGGAHIRGSALLNGGRFEQNRSLGNFVSSLSYGGGGLYIADTLSFTNTVFSGNQAAFLGGGVWAGQDVTGLSGLFQDNTAGRSAGGLLVLSNLTLTNSHFIDNEADFVGGGAFVDGVANLTDVLFQANRVISTALGASSGGLRATEGFTATNTQFIGNSATGGGGGASAFGPINLNNSLFQDNVTNGSGGGLSGSFDPVTATDSQFLNNTAAARGGGIASSGQIFLNNGLFQNNSSLTDDGGGLYTSGRLTLTGAQFINNSAAVDGGGVLANSGVVASDGLFERNRSVAGNGGGINAPLGAFDFENVVLVENSAGGDGGGAYTGFRSLIQNSRFQDNTAANNGGGLWMRNRTLMTATTFINNQAGGLGGGLVITGTFETPNRLINNLFARNTSTSGNGLFISLPDNPNFPDGEFGTVEIIHNTVAAPNGINGAALELISGTVRITNSIIASHTTGIDNAGAIVSQDFNLFFGNGANIQGPAGGGANSIVGNPAFVDPANDDYHLSGDSFALEAGINAGIAIDFEGEPRPGGAGFDIGYDEADFVADPFITASVAPNPALPEQTITYTLTFSNAGSAAARGVVITDIVPLTLTNVSWVAAGPIVTPTPGITLAWQVEDLSAGEGGLIFISGLVSPNLSGLTTFTNTAAIATTSGDSNPGNNAAQAGLQVIRPTVAFSQATYRVNEDGTLIGPAVTLIRSGGANIASQVLVTVTGGSAGSADFDSGSFPLTVDFGPAETSRTLPIAISQDSIDEGLSENIIFEVTAMANSFIGLQNTASLEIVDDDTAALKLTLPGSGLTIIEGMTNSYQLTLASQPTGPVTVTLTPDSQTTPTPAALLFTPLNWSQPQTVAVTALDDGLTEGAHTGLISHTLTSPDPIYAGLVPVTLTASLFDVGTGPPLAEIYMPLVSARRVDAPDLVVDNLIATSSGVTVTLKNIGSASVIDGFWVDVYIKPDTAPTQVNQQWDDLGQQGLVWGVVAPALPIQPGGSLILTIGDLYYQPKLSHFILPIEGPIFAQVDSVNLLTNYGGVLEIHEITGDSYNNISGPFSVTAFAAGFSPVEGQESAKEGAVLDEALPLR